MKLIEHLKNSSVDQRISQARALSELGNALRYLVLPLAVFAVRSSASDLVIAEILETLGFILAGILAPLIIDRLPKLFSLVAFDVASLLVTVLLALGIYLDSLPVLFIGSFLMTFTDTFHSSSLSAVTADFSSGSGISIAKGFSYLQFLILLSGLIGSAIASALVNRTPLYALLIIDGVTFLIASAWIFSIASKYIAKNREVSVAKSSASLSALLRDWREGYVFTIRNREVYSLIFSQAIVGVAHGLMSTSTISHHKTVFQVSDSKVGIAQTMNKVFAFIGAAVRLRSVESPEASMRLGTRMMTLGYFLMSIFPYFGFVIANGLQQFGNALLSPTNRALTMESTPTELRGRIAAFRGLAIDIGILLGNLMALAIVATVGTRFIFLLSALFTGCTLLLIGHGSQAKLIVQPARN